MDQCKSRYIKEEWEDAHESSESDSNGLIHADGTDQNPGTPAMADEFKSIINGLKKELKALITKNYVQRD